MPRVFIGIGSNIDPDTNVPRAIKLLRRDVHILAISTFYRTEAIGRSDQPPFYNGVVSIETDLSPTELKHCVLRRIEEELGRVRTDDKCAPRTIDLDILLYDMLAESVDSDIEKRAFLAIPLYELAPDLVLPGLDRSIKDIAASLENKVMKPLPELTGLLRREIGNEQSQS